MTGCGGVPGELEENVESTEQANTEAGKFHRVSSVHAMKLKDGKTPVRGQDVMLGINEVCIPEDHVDFRKLGDLSVSRLTPWSGSVEDPQCATRPNRFQDHSTHVSGTIIGNAQGGEVNALGMAPEATLLASSLLGGGSRAAWLLALKRSRVVAVNESMGGMTTCDGTYGAEATEEDGVTQALIVHSASNYGYPIESDAYCPPRGWHTLGPQAVAKNLLVVGAIFSDPGSDDPIWTSTGIDWYAACTRRKSNCVGGVPDYFLWLGSSRGPTADGRIKPDVVAESHHCSTATYPERDPPYAPCGGEAGGAKYGTKNGTSMAAPVVTGISGLISQVYRDRFGALPAPAMLKASLIHGAIDRGLIGPDYFFGWGSVDAKNSVDALVNSSNNANTWHQSFTVNAGSTRDFTFYVDTRATPIYGPAGRKLKITAAWHDPAGKGTSKDLKYDMDILLIAPDGRQIYPWTTPYARSCNSRDCNIDLVMEPSTQVEPNHTDNVEQISFAVPANASGEYTLRVSGPAPEPVAPKPQVINLIANHDVFVGTPSATWSFSGAICPGGGSCDLATLGSDVSCTATTCTLLKPVSRQASFNLKLTGSSEAGLYIVEEYRWESPGNVAIPEPVAIFSTPQVPQPAGTEVKSGSAEATYTLSTPGKYRIGGRVRSRAVNGPNGFPLDLVITSQ